MISFTKKIGFIVLDLDYSPIKGPEGNIEYLMFIGKTGDNADINIDEVVERSHSLNNLE